MQTLTGSILSGPASTWKRGNLDTAQVQVQNRVSVALPRLPVDVRAIGEPLAGEDGSAGRADRTDQVGTRHCGLHGVDGSHRQ